jgi:hypothetical protein
VIVRVKTLWEGEGQYRKPRGFHVMVVYPGGSEDTFEVKRLSIDGEEVSVPMFDFDIFEATEVIVKGEEAKIYG